MKRMSVMVAAGLIALQGAGMVFAEEQMQPREAKGQLEALGGPEIPGERLAKQLNLTPEQKEQVTAILKESREKVQAERQKMQESLKTLKAETDQKITALLTSEQAQKYQQLQARRAERREKRAQKIQERK